jgi:hypothetical protein
MPGTADVYGLEDPYDAERAIDAQAHLMRYLLGRFDSVPLALAAPTPLGAVASCGCTPPHPETQDFGTKILGPLGGANDLAVPTFEARLLE